MSTSNIRALPGLLTPSAAYKPFRYPWAYEFWKKQQQVHWMPEEVPLGEDCKDWATKLNDRERNLLTQIFRFFTQSDVEVNDNYMERYARVFKPTEVKMMLAAFSNMETIHIAAYALLLETIGMPDSEFTAFLDYQAMRDKHDYMQQFGVDTNADIARTLAMFGGFTEGLQLFASFAMLMNFPRHNKMKGMGQIVSWSVRDESLHCGGIVKRYHPFNAETGVVTHAVADDIVDCCKTVVGLEDRFIDLAFEAGEVQGMTPDDIKGYIRGVAALAAIYRFPLSLVLYAPMWALMAGGAGLYALVRPLAHRSWRIGERLALASPILILGPAFFSAFTSIKSAVPAIHPYA